MIFIFRYEEAHNSLKYGSLWRTPSRKIYYILTNFCENATELNTEKNDRRRYLSHHAFLGHRLN